MNDNNQSGQAQKPGTAPNANPAPAPNQNPALNPFENIIKRAESFVNDIKKLSDGYENEQKKNTEMARKENELQKERDALAVSGNKLENDLLTLTKSVHSFLMETIAYSSEVYRRGQAEINFRIQAEATQRALAEAAQKVLSDAADRAHAEAEYRKQAEAAQKKMIEQAQQAQSEAAQRIQAELTKTGHIILDSKRVTKPAGTVEKTPEIEVDIFEKKKSDDTVVLDRTPEGGKKK